MTTDERQEEYDALQGRLKGQLADVVAQGKGGYALEDMPRLEGGVLVPSRSVEHAPLTKVEYLPIGSVDRIATTARAVGVYTHSGRFVVQWVGDDEDVKNQALEAVLGCIPVRR